MAKIFEDGRLIDEPETLAAQRATDAEDFATSPSPPPQSAISRRQFFQQLAATPSAADSTKPLISEDEALAAVQTGAIPSEMMPLLSELPVDGQFDAKMKIAGALTFDVNEALTLSIATAYGWTVAQLYDFWTKAGKL